jgi:hypothetical protein
MGLTICEKHVEQGIRLVCAEINSNIVSAARLTDCREIFDQEIPEISYFLCSACFSEYGSHTFEEIPLDPVCGACFREML